MKKNTKIIRLTENDLERMVKRIIKESNNFGSIEDYFSKEKLAEIKETAARLLSPQFFEDYEVTNYISTVSKNNKNVERMLVDWLKSEGLEFYQPEYRSDTGYLWEPDLDKTSDDLGQIFGENYMSDDDYETSTPIKPITIHGKTYKFVEDLPTRELGIGSYVVDNDKGIVLVNGDTPLQDWLTQDMDTNEDYMDDNSNSLLLQKIKSLNPMKSKSKSGRIKYYDNNVELVAVKDKNVLMISGYYFLSDLGWRPTNWSIPRPLDQEMLESFKALWNQHMPPVEIVRIFDYKPEELKGALLTKPDLDKTSDDLGQIFGEDYMEEMPKPGMFHKLKQGVRDLSGIGNKNDNATLKQIYDLISKGMIDNVRRNSDVVTAYVNNKALIVDKGPDAEIIYAGRNLELANLESEAHDLYHLIAYIS